MGTSERTTDESRIIQLGRYIQTLTCLGDLPKQIESDPRVTFDPTVRPDYKVHWGGIHEPSCKSCVIESGFFFNAFHLDTIGLYHHSSLCTPEAIKRIERFDAPAKVEEVRSKYSQGQDEEYREYNPHWKGVVLACQNPTDRSVRSVASDEDYYRFLDEACAYYGSANLFIKLHPWNTGSPRVKIESIAGKYGVTCAKIDHKIIAECEHVLLFNSTFAVDCFLRDIPVVQYAPGYFYQLPNVTYTAGGFGPARQTDGDFRQRLCDFLMWHYCFDYTMPAEDWISMFDACSKSNDMFPIPEEASYGFRHSM